MKEKLTIKERIQALKPAQVIWPLLIILIVLGVAVGVINYQKTVVENKVPAVTVQTPADNTSITNDSVTITGKTDKGSKVTVNNKVVAVDKNGNFSAAVPLAGGANTVTIVTTSKYGKSNIVTKRVTRVIPTPIVQTPSNQAVAGKLSSSGPEDFWIPEAALIAGAFVSWSMTKKNLQKTLARR